MMEVNNIKRGKIANCIAMHDFASEKYDLKSYLTYIEKLFLRYDVTPNRIGITGEKFKGKSNINFNNGKRRLEKNLYQNIESVWIGAIPDVGYDDNFDSIFDAHLSARVDKGPSFVICLDNNIVGFERDLFNSLVGDLSEFFAPTYGYIYQRPFTKGPGFYPYGIIGNDGFSEYEEDMIARWSDVYNMPNGRYKTGDLRDIYPGNILCRTHLDREVFGVRFEEWVRLDSRNGEIERVSEDLWIWWVDEDNISQVREELKPSGMILCV